MANFTAARRYAKALFELCVEQHAVDAVRTDLDGLVGLLRQSDDWATFVTSPTGSIEKRAAVINELLKGKVNALTLQFLAFIDSKRRLPLLADIHHEWSKLYDISKQNLQATAVSAKSLEKSQIDDLSARLSKRYGKNVILATKLDASIIGGLKVYIGDQVLDYSIETQLQILRQRMIYA